MAYRRSHLTTRCRRLNRAGLLAAITMVMVAVAGPASADSARKATAFFGLSVFDLQLDVDSTMDIQGQTHFFSSRPNRYVGGRIVSYSGQPAGKAFWLGGFTGLTWGKSAFLLNWEEPGFVSFDPLDASITTIAWPFGMDLNLSLGNVITLSPFASAKLMMHHLRVEVGDETFSGNAYKLAVAAGGKVSLNLGSFTLAAGASLNHITGGDIDFDVDDLIFESQTTGSTPEYFVGVEVQ